VVVGVGAGAGAEEADAAGAAAAVGVAAAGAAPPPVGATGEAGAPAPVPVEEEPGDDEVLAADAPPPAVVPALDAADAVVDAGLAAALACNALICCMVEEMEECSCAIPDFSLAISDATAAACAVLPVLVAGAVFTE